MKTSQSGSGQADVSHADSGQVDSILEGSPSKVEAIDTLEMRNLSFSYEGQAPVFENLNFSFPMQQNVVIEGSSACGKSTLLRLLAGLLQPQVGYYLMNGYNTAEMSFEEFQPLRARIGYSFDYGGLFANRTLLDNLTLPLLYHKVRPTDESVNSVKDLIKRFGFTQQMMSRPAAVSGGLRKLVCVLRALVMTPELLIMDDPFTGVDAQSCHLLLQEIEECQKRGQIKHVFFTSRDEVWVKRLQGAEPVTGLVIENGQVRLKEARSNERAA